MQRWMMSKLLFAGLLATLGAQAAWSAAHAAPSHPHLPAACIVNCPAAFVHVVTAANYMGSATALDEAIPNRPILHDPSAVVIVTATLTPNGGAFVPSDPHPLAVMFQAGTGNWAILNEDLAPMPLGAAFNVMFSKNIGTAGNVGTMLCAEATYEPGCILDSVPDDPSLVLAVTHNWRPDTPWDPHPVGVWYNTGHGGWAIIHEDGTPIPVGVLYNVLFTSAKGLRQTAAPNNIGPNYTILDNASTNNDPPILLFVTPYHPITSCISITVPLSTLSCSPNGRFDMSPLAMAYLYEQWTIFNTDNATMYTNTSFDVVFW